MECRSFQGDLLLVAGIAATDQLVDEGSIGVNVVEVAATAQQESIKDRFFEMTMGALDDAVLMGLSRPTDR